MQYSEIVDKWVTGFALKNKWKVIPAMDENDLKQECFLLFVKCREIGEKREWDDAHTFNYFKVCCNNILIDQANERTKAKTTALIPAIEARLATTPVEVSTPMHILVEAFAKFVYANTDVTRPSKHCLPYKGVVALMNRLEGKPVTVSHLNGLIARVGKKRIRDFVSSY